VKFILDENLPVELARHLQSLGHDTDTVIDEGLRGVADQAVVDAAQTGDRILMTLDKGIGNIRRFPISQHGGVVLLRPDTAGRKAVTAFILERLAKITGMDLAGRLVVVGPSRIRLR